MSENYLPCVELEPEGPATCSVVWLHGLGADGHDFEPIVPHLGLARAGVRFIFPHAPRRPVTINMGMIMPAWYDIRQTDLRREHDDRGVRESSEQVGALIRREVQRGVESGRIVLAGFSQGGAIALHLGLRWPERLAGILALSTYLLHERVVEVEAHPANRATPIFQAHGTHDPMVPLDRGEAARESLSALGYDVEWKTYPMGHEVCPAEIHDVGVWLGRVLGAGGA